jgi:hypothetical protein
MPKKHKLSKLKVNEVSLVGSGANNKTFNIRKEGGEEMPNTAIQKILDAKIDNPEKLEEITKRLSAEDKAKVLGAAKLLKSIDVLPDGVLNAVLDVAGKQVSISKEDIEKAVQEALKKKADEEKAAADALKKAQEGKLEMEGIPEPVQKAINQMAEAQKAQAEEIKKMQEDSAADKETIKKMQEEKEHDALIKKAGEFSGVCSDTETLANVLGSVPEEHRDGLEKVLKSAQAIMKSSGLFKELGSPLPGDGGDSAEDAYKKLQKMAEEVVQKGGTSLTQEQAFAKVYKENPELAARSKGYRQFN